MGTPKQGDLLVVDESKIREIPTPDTTPEFLRRRFTLRGIKNFGGSKLKPIKTTKARGGKIKK